MSTISNQLIPMIAITAINLNDENNREVEYAPGDTFNAKGAEQARWLETIGAAKFDRGDETDTEAVAASPETSTGKTHDQDEDQPGTAPGPASEIGAGSRPVQRRRA